MKNNSHPLSDQLQVWGFEEGFTVFSDGSLGFALSLDTLDVSFLEAPEIDTLAERVRSFLNALPQGVNLQFIQDIESGNNLLLEKLTDLKNDLSPSSQDLFQERTLFLKSKDADGLIPRQRNLLFVRRFTLQARLKNLNPFAKKLGFQQVTEEYLQKEIKAIDLLKSEIIAGLRTLGVLSTELSCDEISRLIYRQWNPDRPIELAVTHLEDIRESLLFTDLAIHQKGISLGGMHYRLLSLKLLPEQTMASMAVGFQNLPMGSRVFVTVAIPDQEKELQRLQSQRRMAFAMARGKREGVSDLESEAKFQDLEELLAEIVSDGEKIFQVSVNVLLKHPDIDILEGQVGDTLTAFRELGGCEGMVETIATWDVFSEIAVPNAMANERAKRLKTRNAVDFLPLYGNWKGHDMPRAILRSNQGSLFSFDPFAPELTNYNQIVTGGSGSGKSFLTNLLLLQMLKENPRIFIVDVGGSYKKLCDNLDGQYIPLDLSANLSLNPFDLGAGETLPSPQKIKFLVGLIERMTKEANEVGLGRLERAEIETTLAKLYEEHDVPSLSGFRDELLSHPDLYIQRLGKILSPWCGNTPYGRFVDRPTSIHLEKRLVSFDLKGLESYPDLQAVCLYLITDFVWREVQKNKSEAKFLILDECWKLLESDSGSAFIAEVFRTFRKYYASAIAISQNIDDFAKSRVSSAILTNTAVKWILKQKGADRERLKEVLHLNYNEVAQIANLNSEKGFFSQAFLIAEDKHALVTIEPTPLEYWVATTDARDLAELEKIQNQNPELCRWNILKMLAAQFPRGVAAKGSK